MDALINSIREVVVDNQEVIIRFFLVLVVGYLAIKFIKKLIKKHRVFSRLDKTVVGMIQGVITFFLYAIYVITLLTILGVPMTTFVAILSAMGLAVALALQGNLANFAGAIMILIFKPFEVGDFIESQGTMGTVHDIQLFFTHLLTPDNRKVVIPNAELVSARVTNFTSEETRRIDLVFGVSYDSDIEQVKSLILEVINLNDMIINEPEPLVRVCKHNDSSLDYDVKVWVNKDNYWPVRYDLHEQIKKTFDANQVVIPYPQNDVHIKNETV